MTCLYCHSDWEKDELFHGICPDCVEMVLDDWKKEIEFIENTGKSDDFYVCYYFNIPDTDYDPQLMFVCRRFIRDQLELYSAEVRARLRDYVKDYEEEYIRWLTGF